MMYGHVSIHNREIVSNLLHRFFPLCMANLDIIYLPKFDHHCIRNAIKKEGFTMIESDKDSINKIRAQFTPDNAAFNPNIAKKLFKRFGRLSAFGEFLCPQNYNLRTNPPTCIQQRLHPRITKGLTIILPNSASYQ